MQGFPLPAFPSPRRRFGTAALGAAATASPLTATAAAGADKARVEPYEPTWESVDRHFHVVNLVNSLALSGGGTVGTTMTLTSPEDRHEQRFHLIETDGGHYRLINRANGLAVDGRGATNAGAAVGQWNWDGGPNLQWLPTDLGNGLFLLRNRATGLALDGVGTVPSGSPAKQWPANDSPNLLWRLMAAPI